MGMKRFGVWIWAVLFAMVSCSSVSAAGKVGYINLQRLVAESKIGKEAKKEIQQMREEKEKALNAKSKAVNDLKELLEKTGDQMEPREKRNRSEELRRAYRDYQMLLNDAKEDLLKEDREVVAIILKKADGVLKEVAKKAGYSIILKDPNAIGYLDDDVDITDEVLKQLNRRK